jgi:hypothetical protein
MIRTIQMLPAVLLLAAGCASSPNSPPAQKLSENRAPPPHCVQSGSRIKDHCSPGQSYTREDLERTGGINLSESLDRLSPSLSRR